VGGGKQVRGFLGIGIQYFYSSKFIQYDGGWRRVVWMASDLKERVKDAIPDEMRDKIATEKEAADLESLREFLLRVDHPVVKGVIREVDGAKITDGWAKKEEEAGVAAPEEVAAPTAAVAESEAEQPASAPGSVPVSLPVSASTMLGDAPIKIRLKNADISIGKMRLRLRHKSEKEK